jgi:hypothetical protein
MPGIATASTASTVDGGQLSASFCVGSTVVLQLPCTEAFPLLLRQINTSNVRVPHSRHVFVFVASQNGVTGPLR